MFIPLVTAVKMINASSAEASSMGIKICTAIVDDGGHLVALDAIATKKEEGVR